MYQREEKMSSKFPLKFEFDSIRFFCIKMNVCHMIAVACFFLSSVPYTWIHINEIRVGTDVGGITCVTQIKIFRAGPGNELPALIINRLWKKVWITILRDNFISWVFISSLHIQRALELDRGTWFSVFLYSSSSGSYFIIERERFIYRKIIT